MVRKSSLGSRLRSSQVHPGPPIRPDPPSKGLKKLIKRAYLEEGEVDEDVVKMIRDKMRGLEPSENAIIERLMKEESERNMTEEQIHEREEKKKFDKEKTHRYNG